MGYTPPKAPTSPDKVTSGDVINPDAKGRTGTSFEPATVAQPWDRGMAVLENEPVTSLADSGLSDVPGWSATSLHPDNGETFSAGPGTASTLGAWPISGTEIHGRGGEYQQEKDLGPGASKGTAPGFGGD